MADLTLPPRPTLQDLQAYVARTVQARGFDMTNIAKRFMLLTEEVGELSKAARQQAGLKMADNAAAQNAAHEAADVFIVLLSLCNMLDIDLETAVREKEELNKQRVWK